MIEPTLDAVRKALLQQASLTMPNPPVYSIIAPVFNELENLPELYRRVSEVMEQTGEPWELVLVDDGSRDGSTELDPRAGSTKMSASGR